MGLILKLALSAAGIVGGQSLMTIYIRSAPALADLGTLVRYSLGCWAFYAFVLSYGLGLAFNIALLRHFPLAEVSTSILAITMVLGVAATFLLGQQLAIRQLLGIALVFSGMALLQSGG
jgi:drug/metabolite transporter (DMT)-like permease